MSTFIDRFVVVILKFTAKLPFWFIWRIADVSYFLVYYVIRYRRKVVMNNLRNSFPEKSPKEIRRIAKKFYRHLSDLGLETVKFSQMTEEEMKERVVLHDENLFEDYYQAGKSYILLGMHYNNWEWCLYLQRYLKSTFYVVYNPVRENKILERFILDARERFGAVSVVVNHSVRTALNFNQADDSRTLILMADQTPPANSQMWTNFLNQETAFFAGPMKIAKKTNLPVCFHYARKTGRGRYEVFPMKLVENPAEMKAEEILMAYIREIEKIIRKEPEYWLWSHRRWKHKRPENIELYTPEQ